MGFMDRGDQECVKCVKKLETGIKIETHIISPKSGVWCLVGTDFMTSPLNVRRCNESKFFITRR